MAGQEALTDTYDLEISVLEMRGLGQRLLLTLVFLIPKVVDFPFPFYSRPYAWGRNWDDSAMAFLSPIVFSAQ